MMHKRVIGQIKRSAQAYLAGFAYLFCCVVLLLVAWNQVSGADPTRSIGLFALTEILFMFVVAVIVSMALRLFSGNGSSHLVMLSSRPGEHNYNWQGGYSVLTAALLFLLMIMRSVSVLQFCKLIYRKAAKADTDFASRRPNVSPSFQEVYILIWAVLLMLQVSLRYYTPIAFALDVYFLIESVTWILYYAVFRRFFEEKYAIYHVLEHLPTIFIMIPLQAIAYAAALTERGGSVSWRDILPVLLGQASENRVVFSILGFLYSAIVISMVIGSFPPEDVKNGNPNTIIIGAGDVVRNRLLPAVIGRMDRIAENRTGEVHIYTRETIPDLPEAWGIRHPEAKYVPTKTESIYSLVSRKPGGSDVIVWIETPSDTHLYYLEAMLDKADLIAMEKPVVAGMSDLMQLKEILASEHRKKIFFLSYYILEKALVLTFLKRPNSFYLKYLEGDTAKYYQMSLELGRLKSACVQIIEAQDNRPLPEGGQLIDTFIHHCLIASLFAGLPSTWTVRNFIEQDTEAQFRMQMSALGERGEEIELLLIKGFDDEHPGKTQRADFVFEHGTLTADFDARSAVITGTGTGESACIEVSSLYRGPYEIQCDMVYECYANGIDPSGLDGLYHQIEVLEWLLDFKNRRKKTETDGMEP